MKCKGVFDGKFGLADDNNQGRSYGTDNHSGSHGGQGLGGNDRLT